MPRAKKRVHLTWEDHARMMVDYLAAAFAAGKEVVSIEAPDVPGGWKIEDLAFRSLLGAKASGKEREPLAVLAETINALSENGYRDVGTKDGCEMYGNVGSLVAALTASRDPTPDQASAPAAGR